MMKNKRKIIISKAIENQTKYDRARSKTNNKKRLPPIQHQVGDMDLNDVARRVIGNEKKLDAAWIEPFEIIEMINQISRKMREVGNEVNIETQNIRFLKPYILTPCTHVMNQSLRTMKCHTVMEKIKEKINLI